MDRGDLGLAEHAGDAARELGDDRFLAREHLGDVDRGAGDGDAVVAQVVLDLLVALGGIEEGLGGDAAHVEAGAAEAGLAFLVRAVVDAGGLEAELARANGRHVPAGAAADDHYVENVHDEIPLVDGVEKGVPPSPRGVRGE
ncbi:hypothetical protein D3C86_1833090 [compost metagenome]